MITPRDERLARARLKNKALAGAPENKGAVPGVYSALQGVEFASDEAAEAAQREGLAANDFAGHEPSGVHGYTVADVRAIAEG